MPEYRSKSVRDVQVYDMTRDGKACRLSEHFLLSEFACSDGSHVVLIHPSLIDLLEAIRKHLNDVYPSGAPIKINSGYRTVSYNGTIGGAKESRHVLGMAADIHAYRTIRGAKIAIDPNDVAAIAEVLGAGGVGRYKTFTHVDVDSENRRWDKRSDERQGKT